MPMRRSGANNAGSHTACRCINASAQGDGTLGSTSSSPRTPPCPPAAHMSTSISGVEWPMSQLPLMQTPSRRLQATNTVSPLLLFSASCSRLQVAACTTNGKPARGQLSLRRATTTSFGTPEEDEVQQLWYSNWLLRRCGSCSGRSWWAGQQAATTRA